MAKTVVVGMRELERKLKALEALPESPKLIHIFTTAAKIGENAVWAQAPVGRTGNLRKGISSGKLDNPEIGAYVAANARHSHLLEFGTKPRKQTTSGRATGKGPPTRFFSKGLAVGRRRFRPYLVDGLQRLVEDEAK